MLSGVDNAKGPIDPPYPNPGALPVWQGRLLLLSWVAGIVLLCLRIDLGAILFISLVLWFVHLVWQTGRWRERALDGLEARAGSITEQERERDLADIYDIYGGKPFPKVKRRVEAIRAIPPRADESAWSPSLDKD